MNRREFLKLIGLGAATIAASRLPRVPLVYENKVPYWRDIVKVGQWHCIEYRWDRNEGINDYSIDGKEVNPGNDFPLKVNLNELEGDNCIITFQMNKHHD